MIDVGIKELYNMDNYKSARDLAKCDVKTVDCVPLSSALNSKTKQGTKIAKDNYLGTMLARNNNVYENSQGVSILSSGFSNSTSPTFSITVENFSEGCSYFTARKSIAQNWMNDKDEYFGVDYD